MKRITISLADDLAGIVEREARRRHTSVSDVVRAAITSHFKLDEPRELGFANLYSNGSTDAAERLEEILDTNWADWIKRDSFNSDR
jgi:Arc/MetJ-type ribon-helix-helix transcriptional regulator